MDESVMGPPILITTDPTPRLLASSPSRLTHDFRRTYGCWADGGTCRIRIFEGAGRPPVVVCSQIESAPGTSVCSVAEYLAAEVVGRYFPSRFDEPEPVVWLEHHPCCEDRRRRGAARLDVARVTFASWKPTIIRDGRGWRAKLGHPTWTPLSAEDLPSLIGDPSAIDE